MRFNQLAWPATNNTSTCRQGRETLEKILRQWERIRGGN
jgi:hypothetical protein